MKEIGLYDIKTRLSAVIAELETSGEPVAITRHGRIVAELHPHQPDLAPRRGFLKSSTFRIAPDFDDAETGFEDFFSDGLAGSRVAEDAVPSRHSRES